MRLFWAIELPDEVRDRLVALQDELRQSCRDGVRWSRPEQLHLTVQFLGEVEDPAPIVEAVQALSPPGLLELEVGGLGTFGGRNPRVIWAGVGGAGRDRLVALAGQVQAALAPLGFRPDHARYSPHVTLGRINDRRRGRPGKLVPGKVIQSALERVALEPLPFTAGELVLLRSTAGAGRGPATYTPTGSWSLSVSP